MYSMIASALYVRLTKSKIDSKISNEGRTYFSVGTSVTRVPYEEIRRYFRRKAALDSVQRFVSDVTDAGVEDQVDALLTLLGLEDPRRDFLAYDISREVTGPMQAFAKRCMEPGGFFDNRLADLQASLMNQNPDEADRLIAELLGEAAQESPDFLTEVARSYVDAFCAHSIKTAGANAITDENAILEAVLAHALGVLERTGSARGVHKFCVAAVNRIQGLRDSVFSSNGIEQWLSNSGINPASAASTLGKVRGREGFLGMTGAYFSDDEVAEVMADARQELAVVTLRALGRMLTLPPGGGAEGGLLTRITGMLQDAADRADFLCRCAAVAQDRMNINIEGLKSDKSKLFDSVDSDGKIVDDADMNIDRKIRPLFPADNELVLNAGAAGEFAAAVIRGRDRKGEVYEYTKNQTEPLDRESWLSSLESAFRESNYQANFPEGPRSVMDKFRLTKVLRDLSVQWRKRLQEAWKKGNKDEYYEKAQKFRNYFGIEPSVVGDTIEISGGDEFRSAAGEDFLVLGLAAASVRACRPFWKTASNAEHSPHLIVQVPVSMDQDSVSQWTELIQRHSNIPVQDKNQIELIANETAGSANEHNPYVLVVYTSTAANSLDQVTTLDAWKNNDTLLNTLRLAEDIDGKCPMPFNDEIERLWREANNEYRGSGFTDPSYIYRPELRRNRWRPWVPMEEQERQAQESDGSKAALVAVYACLGPKWYLEAALGEEQAKAVLAETGLPGDPIFAEGERKMYKLGRLPFFIRAGKPTKDESDIRIKIGSNVTQSIRTIPDVLAGKQEARSARGAGTDHLVVLGKSIEREYDDFFGKFAEDHGFHAGSAKAAHLKMLGKLKQRFIEERQDSNPNQEDGDRAFWQSVLNAAGKRITELGG
jgi:hypothetical protein